MSHSVDGLVGLVLFCPVEAAWNQVFEILAVWKKRKSGFSGFNFFLKLCEPGLIATFTRLTGLKENHSR